VRKTGRWWTSPDGVSRALEAGEIIGAAKIARDISGRNRLERELRVLLAREQGARATRRRQPRQGRIPGHSVPRAAHPLNAVYGWANILKGGEVDEATAARGLDAIVRNSNARCSSSTISSTCPASCRARCASTSRRSTSIGGEGGPRLDEPAAAAKNIRLHTVLDPRAGPITGIRTGLQQVVWNLVSNAVKFTPRGGQIQIHLQRINSHVELVVSDTGQGIGPELLPFLFERFRQGDSSTTRQHEGLGLGLALVKYLTELHGGTVSAHSLGAGKGATFTVKLPLTIVQAAPETEPGEHPTAARTERAPAGPRLDGLRILVVDDDQDSLDLASAILSGAGAVVTTSRSAAEGSGAGASHAPRCADLRHRDARRGRLCAHPQGARARPLERWRHPAVALTAYGRVEDRLRTIPQATACTLPKPVQPVELTTIVASLAGR